ncbi:glycosyltransferase [Acinetobacter rathckeae]|uniref:glycosyltransferase n=1 Tax=Acinetobacter rathckeae TaxID=2605272 RepID=UPI0018A2F131|nr:glycosyltransferase [Acinetobacter rathckeae]MBF7688993.1 glycosyltransferase [Acinetobacter rathckeae]
MGCPVVSVIVPSYNHAQFLEQRLESILKQTFQDFELIILDDLSPDNSRNIIEKYRQHPKVSHIVYNEKNSGSTFFQWNKAVFELAQGQFIWIAESDDVAEPTLLETLVTPMQAQPKIAVAYCQSTRMNACGEVTGDWLSHTSDLTNPTQFQQAFSMQGTAFINQYLVYKNTIPNASAVVFNANTYRKVGGAQPSLRTNGDWDLWFKMLLLGDVFYTPEQLNHFRYHDASVIAKEDQRDQTKRSRRLHKKKMYQYGFDVRASMHNAMLSCQQSSLDAFKINKKRKQKNKKHIIWLSFLVKLMPA